MNNSATQGLYKVNILLPLCNWSVWNMPLANVRIRPTSLMQVTTELLMCKVNSLFVFFFNQWKEKYVTVEIHP